MCPTVGGSRAGEETPLSFTLTYAAPEVIAAYEAGNVVHVVQGAADVWALGVIAFELLTKERAFGMHASAAEMLQRVASSAPLPWEEGAPSQAARLAQLRVLRRSVLQCLVRDPGERPTSEALLQSWSHMFDATRSAALGGVPVSMR